MSTEGDLEAPQVTKEDEGLILTPAQLKWFAFWSLLSYALSTILNSLLSSLPIWANVLILCGLAAILLTCWDSFIDMFNALVNLLKTAFGRQREGEPRYYATAIKVASIERRTATGQRAALPWYRSKSTSNGMTEIQERKTTIAQARPLTSEYARQHGRSPEPVSLSD